MSHSGWLNWNICIALGRHGLRRQRGTSMHSVPLRQILPGKATSQDSLKPTSQILIRTETLAPQHPNSTPGNKRRARTSRQFHFYFSFSDKPSVTPIFVPPPLPNILTVITAPRQEHGKKKKKRLVEINRLWRAKTSLLPHGFLCRKASAHQLPFLQVHSKSSGTKPGR